MRANFNILIAGCIGMLGIAFATRFCADTAGRGSANSGHPSHHDNPSSSTQSGDSPTASASKRPREPESELTQLVREKLDSIIIPKVDFESTTAEEAIDFLRLRVVELDPDPDYRARGMAFHVNRPKDPDLAPQGSLTSKTTVDVDSIGHDFKADNISAWQLLKRVASDNRMRIEVTERGVELTTIDQTADGAVED